MWRNPLAILVLLVDVADRVGDVVVTAERPLCHLVDERFPLLELRLEALSEVDVAASEAGFA